MRAPVLQEVHRQVDRKSRDAEHMPHLQEIYYRACGMQPVCRMNGFCLCSHVSTVHEVLSTDLDMTWEIS